MKVRALAALAVLTALYTPFPIGHVLPLLLRRRQRTLSRPRLHGHSHRIHLQPRRQHHEGQPLHCATGSAVRPQRHPSQQCRRRYPHHPRTELRPEHSREHRHHRRRHRHHHFRLHNPARRHGSYRNKRRGGLCHGRRRPGDMVEHHLRCPGPVHHQRYPLVRRKGGDANRCGRGNGPLRSDLRPQGSRSDRRALAGNHHRRFQHRNPGQSQSCARLDGASLL